MSNQEPEQEEPTRYELGEMAPWVEAYTTARSQVQTWQEIMDEAKDRLSRILKDNDAQIGLVDGKPAVSYKTFTTKRFDTKAFKNHQPELYDKYVNETVSHRFTPIEGNK